MGGEEEIASNGGMSDCIHMAKAKLSMEKRISNMPKRHRISDECSSNMFLNAVKNILWVTCPQIISIKKTMKGVLEF